MRQKIASDSFNWRLYNELGQIFYTEGRFDEAIAAYQQAINLNPISRTLEAERQQQEASDAQRKSMEQQQAAQAIGVIFGALGGVGGAVGGLGGQALQVAGAVGQMGAGLGNVASQYIPGGQLDSQVKAKRETAQIYHNLGDAYMGKGDYNEAAKSFEQSASLDPSRMNSLQSTGSAHLRQAEYDKAAATLNRLLVLNPTDPHPVLFLWLSLAYKHQGKNREETETREVAINRLRALAAKHSQDAATLNSIADAYFEMSYFQEAAQIYEQSLALQKNQPFALRRLGICYYATGRYPDAARVLKEGTSLMRNDSSGWLWLGRSHEKMGSTTEAQDAFNEAIGSDTEDWGSEPPPVSVAAAYAARGTGSHTISISWLEDLFSRSPASSYRAFELGLAYEKAGRYEDALEAFDRSVWLNPSDSLARDALERAGRLLAEKAAEDLQRATAAASGRRFPEAIQQFTSALQRLPEGQAKQDALLKLLRLVATMPTPPPLTEQGERYFARGNAMLKSATSPDAIDRAILEFRSAIRRSPWWTNSYLNLGLAYAQRRLYRDATLYFKLYLIANPDAKNAGAVREQIYELEYKQEREVRLPPLLSRLRYRKDYGEMTIPAAAVQPTPQGEKPATPPQEGAKK
jgi:tetratricopeptide (TPR) repeat protein